MIAIYKKLTCTKLQRKQVTLIVSEASCFYYDKFAKFCSADTNPCQCMVLWYGETWVTSCELRVTSY